LPEHWPAPLRDAFQALKAAAVTRVEERAIDPALMAASRERLEKYTRATLARIRDSFLKMHQWKRNQIAPTPEQVARFDALAARIAAGEDMQPITIASQGRTRFSFGNSRTSTRLIEELNALYKTACGHSFYTMDEHSLGRTLSMQVLEMKRTLDRCAQADAGASEAVKRRTQFLDDAREIDMMRASDYWSLLHEMLARAFAGYISDRLSTAGRRSDYLVYAAENKYYALLGKPYPEGAERILINERFTALLQQWKEIHTCSGGL
jgi:hypothetical protein